MEEAGHDHPLVPNHHPNHIMKSWKTSVGGLLLAAGQLLAPGLPPDLAWIGTALTGLGALILGLNARDNHVSTEQARK